MSARNWRWKTTLGCFVSMGCSVAVADRALDRLEETSVAIEQVLHAAVEQYFEAWSSADIGAYGRSFHPSAVIHHRDKRGRLRRMMLNAFLDGQRAAHAAVPGMVEVPVIIEISHDAYAAQARVHWQLVADQDVSCGEDHFQFSRVGQDWKITSLLFYESPCRAPE